MRATLVLTALTALLLLTPQALAAAGEGAFATPQPVALWGSLRLDAGEAPLTVEHRGAADAFLLTAHTLTIRVETLQRTDGAEEHREVEEHVYHQARVRVEDGTGLLLRLAPGGRLDLASSEPAPQSRAEWERMPTAMVLPGGSAGAAEADASSCDARACPAGPREAPAMGALELHPFAPVQVSGALEVLVLPGGRIGVAAAEGEAQFTADRTEETRTSGGVRVPLLGTTVAGERQRTETITIVTILADQAGAEVIPAPPAFGHEASAAEDRSGEAAAAREAPHAATVVRGDGPLALRLEGSVGLREADGGIEVQGQPHEARGADVLLAGTLDLTFHAARQAAEGGRSGLLGLGGSREAPERLQVQVAGDVTRVDVAGAAADGVAMYQAAAAAGALGAVGMLALFAPAAKYGFSKVMAVPLYARLEKQQLLDNTLRAQLLALVRREPGASPAELARQMPCSWNTLVYHLSVLEREGYVTRTREGRRWRFFPTGAQDHSALPALAAMKNPRAAQLIAAIRAEPGIAQHQLSARVAVQPSTVHFHLQKLLEAGVVRAERDGRTVRYYEGPPAAVAGHSGAPERADAAA